MLIEASPLQVLSCECAHVVDNAAECCVCYKINICLLLTKCFLSQ